MNFSLWKVPNLVVQICLERSDDGSLKGPLWVSFAPVGGRFDNLRVVVQEYGFKADICSQHFTIEMLEVNG